MKAFISILAALVLGMAVWKLWDYYDQVGTEKEASINTATGSGAATPQLPSLPAKLEQELAEAKKKGAIGLKAWLDRYKLSPVVKDPRLAWIELDYVVMLSPTDPVQAKKIFGEVKKRTPPDSPVYPRIKDLEKTYE
jgi:hypothetical protein